MKGRGEMADTLEKPKIYNNPSVDDEDVKQPKRRSKKEKKKKKTSSKKQEPKDVDIYVDEPEETVIKPKRGTFGMRGSDIFVTGAFDIPFFALSMVILAIGLVMLFSASYASSYYEYGNSYHYFLRQLIFAVIGIALMFFFSKFNYRWFKALAPILLGITLFLLVLVLFYHTEISTSGGDDFKRYIKIPGINLTFQPSDIAKFTIITTLATYICKHANHMGKVVEGFIVPLVIIAVYCGLVMAENHLSGTILLAVIGLTVLFAGGSNKKLFVALIAVGVVAVVFVLLNYENDFMPDYVQEKITAWLDKDYEPLGSRWQTNNSLYAIGSGGLFGVGLGNSKQKYLYVSEPQNDFIFSIVCEELGFVGAAVIIILFMALVGRGIYIALKCDDRFGSLMTIGIMAQIGVQVALNVLVVTDTIPNTGIALPFFSYGGTALIMQLVEVGIVLGVSRKSNQKKAEIED